MTQLQKTIRRSLSNIVIIHKKKRENAIKIHEHKAQIKIKPESREAC